MSTLVLEPTVTAQWHSLVSEAEVRSARRLDETLESYLVFLLMRFSARPSLASSVMARDFLEGVTTPGRLGQDRLRDVGDQCLLFSGLFPRRAERRLVRISYYVDLGRAAYGQLAEDKSPGSSALFAQLAHGFVALMEVLQAMSSLTGAPTLDLLQAIDLWHDTGSSRALREWRSPADAPACIGNNRKKH